MPEPIVLPSGYCFACHGEETSIICGYCFRCPYCGGAASIGELQEEVAYNEDRIWELEHLVEHLREELAKYKEKEAQMVLDIYTEIWS